MTDAPKRRGRPRKTTAPKPETPEANVAAAEAKDDELVEIRVTTAASFADGSHWSNGDVIKVSPAQAKSWVENQLAELV